MTCRLGQHVREVPALDGAVSERRIPGVQPRLEGMLVRARDEQRQPHTLEPPLARPRLSQGDELATDAAAAPSGAEEAELRRPRVERVHANAARQLAAAPEDDQLARVQQLAHVRLED